MTFCDGTYWMEGINGTFGFGMYYEYVWMDGIWKEFGTGFLVILCI